MSFFQWLRTQSKFLSFIISSITVSCPVHRKCCFTANKAPLVHVAQTYILVVTIHCLALCHTNPSATCRVAPPPPPCAMLRPPPPSATFCVASPPLSHVMSYHPFCHTSCHATPLSHIAPSAKCHVVLSLHHVLHRITPCITPHYVPCCIITHHVSICVVPHITSPICVH